MAKKLSFSEIKKNYFYLIADVALDYASSDDDVTLTVLSEKYNISYSTVRSCIRYAVIHCLVHFTEVRKMKNKAHRNQVRHIKNHKGEIVTSSDKYYARLIFNRRFNLASILDKKVNELHRLDMEVTSLKNMMIDDLLNY